jgi:hypothetical protein
VNRDTLRELAVFGLLLAIGVLGRWAQPDWNFTPIAAVTVLGGFYFRRLLPAVLLPVSILAISDLLLVAHDSWPVLVTVHAMMILPLLLGRSARGTSGRQAAWRWGLCGVVPATAFYVVTNFSVWAFTGLYVKTFAGLSACYVAAVPFYRTMLLGDMFYLAVLLGCLAIARTTSKTPAVATAKVR